MLCLDLCSGGVCEGPLFAPSWMHILSCMLSDWGLYVHACRFRNNFTLDELLSVRDVLGPPEASPKAFLDTCTKALVAALVRFKRDSELHEVAAILGQPSPSQAFTQACPSFLTPYKHYLTSTRRLALSSAYSTWEVCTTIGSCHALENP